MQEYGDESWELDALDPATLAGLIQDGIDEVVDPELMQDAIAEQERQRIARLNAQPNSRVLLAEEGGRPVGLLTAVGGERNRLRHSAGLALGVAKSHWGQGIATAMVREAVAWSATAGLKRLELTVHTANLAAVSVYLRCGFQVEGVRRSSLLVDGVYVDEYMMSLLNPQPS